MNLIDLLQPLWTNISKDILYTAMVLLLFLECYKRYQSLKDFQSLKRLKFKYEHPIELIEFHKLWLEGRLGTFKFKMNTLKYFSLIPIIFLLSRDLIIKYTNLSLSTYSIILLVTVLVYTASLIRTYNQYVVTQKKLTNYEEELLIIKNPELFIPKNKELKRGAEMDNWGNQLPVSPRRSQSISGNNE
ncbi:hypothetical protein [Bacillus cereus group sp. BfR-BA-01380]|uniref:hypothetical protein n=1 Tax=Bacillus cereus group sp. BfR-BA-01380 TaxID=2920324 RepID=UPI001F582C3D|nr:hypothetical protein [Bacillus cereus group sp. BfR-BA-01380]